jgi:hypothetical protein
MKPKGKLFLMKAEVRDPQILHEEKFKCLFISREIDAAHCSVRLGRCLEKDYN